MLNFVRNKSGQSSFEFLLIIVVVFVLAVIVFVNVPSDTKEIVALGITRNIMDEFVLKENYTGKYTLDSNVNGASLDITIAFSPKPNVSLLPYYISKIKTEVQKSTDFNNVGVYYK